MSSATLSTVEALFEPANWDANGNQVSLTLLIDAYLDAGDEARAEACRRILAEGWEPEYEKSANIWKGWNWFRPSRARRGCAGVIPSYLYDLLRTSENGWIGTYDHPSDAYRDLVRVLVEEAGS